jgi:hypothetical protein
MLWVVFPETAMTIPFSIDQFFDVFIRYNSAIWPAQWLLAALGLTFFERRKRTMAATSRIDWWRYDDVT